MPTYQGRPYSLVGSPEGWVADDDGSPAPPDAAEALYRRQVRKGMRQLGLKPAGRKKLPEGKSRPEQMQADLERNGYDYEATAERFGVKPKTVEDKTRKLRQ
jgi:hypothetical protein